MADGVTGLDELLARVREMQRRAADVEPPLRASGAHMLGSIEQNFRAQGRPKKWQRLAPRTLARRRRGRGAGSPQILIDTARLKNSMATNLTSTSVETGTNAVYARRQHYGFPGGKGRGRSRTPARPYLMFQPEDVREIGEIFGRYITR